jgi:hypothetical protein
MSNRGFLIYAEGSDYFEQAYLCALSLKATDNKFPISIVTDQPVEQKHKDIFDHILDIPWYKQTNTRLKTENRWKLYHASPYEKTIVLDSDVLVLQNLDYFWGFVENYNLYYPTTVFTYRKEEITSDYYRKAFTANNLPNFYNCVHYFKKTDWTKQFFHWVETITNNWELFYGQFCPHYYPEEPSMDVTTAIASKILDCDYEISNKKQHSPQIVHMKTHIQEWRVPKTRWQSKIGVYITDDLQLKLGNHRQDTIVHYTEKDFCTADKIEKYEKMLDVC